MLPCFPFFAREATGHFVKEHILSQPLPAARAFSSHHSIIIVRGMGLCPMFTQALDLRPHLSFSPHPDPAPQAALAGK